MRYSADIEAIDWENLETAYGSAKPIPALLISVLSEQESVALDAASELEGYLYHQHVQLHTASVAALPFILEALTKTSVQVKEELLFVLVGYALATEDGFWVEKPKWVSKVTELLCKEVNVIESFKNSESEDSVFFASQITTLLKQHCESAT